MNKPLTFISLFALALVSIGIMKGPVQSPPLIQKQAQPNNGPVQPPPPSIQQPRPPAISTRIPSYLAYPQLVQQLQKWNQEAPDFTEVGTYGKTSRGQDIYYIRVGNKMSQAQRPKVLITACIHGNEPLSCSTVMGYIGTLLGTYTTDAEVKELLDTRDIYFIPVISPDSYPNSRHVDGVDPNRDFPGPHNWNKTSVPPVKAVQTFFLQHRFKAVISGHTFGRVFLTPYGDTNNRCANEADYQRIVFSKMCQMTGYRHQHACENYGRPIQGSEVDWYYRHEAFSMVMEFGTHQRIPSQQDIQVEFDKTYRAILHWLKEGALVQVRAER